MGTSGAWKVGPKRLSQLDPRQHFKDGKDYKSGVTSRGDFVLVYQREIGEWM